ncbi:MAG: hypothetical protein EOM35_02240 [Negativicutes bacterium]|nr:hypothetical protein [Negativicutes bacterium]
MVSKSLTSLALLLSLCGNAFAYSEPSATCAADGGHANVYDKTTHSWKCVSIVATGEENDPIYSASSWFGTENNAADWDTAYGWGNHADAGYLTSFTETDPVYSASSWFSTTNNASNWNDAYSWGDHADAGYLTSFTETDPIYSASSWVGTTNNAANWNTAYGWGNHATAGYLTAEVDPVYSASSWFGTTNNAANWNTAYGWGNHATAGYALSSSLGTMATQNANSVAITGGYLQNLSSVKINNTSSVTASLNVNGISNSDWLALFTATGTTPEETTVPNLKSKAVTVQSTEGAYFVGRDTNADIDFAMGTSTSGLAFAGAMSGHDFELRTGNTAKMRINHATGNVGIGTTNPAYKLDVSGTIRSTSALIAATATIPVVHGEADTVATINGKVAAGTNVTVTGSGTAASPYVIASTATGTGAFSGTSLDTLTGATATQSGVFYKKPTAGTYGLLPAEEAVSFGAVCDGTTDDTTALSNASATLSAAGGGRILISGNCRVCGLTLYRNTIFEGKAFSKAQLTATSTCTADPTIATENFASLDAEGTHYFGNDSDVPSWAGFRNIRIVGNWPDGITRKVVGYYGAFPIFQNVHIEGGHGDLLYTRHPSTTVGYLSGGVNSQEESLVDNLWLMNTGGGNGWTFHGPMDLIVGKVVSGHIYDGYGFYATEQIGYIGFWHDYASALGIYIGGYAHIGNIITDGSRLTIAGNDVQINQLTQWFCAGGASPCLNVTGDNASISNHNLGVGSGSTSSSTAVSWSGDNGYLNSKAWGYNATGWTAYNLSGSYLTAQISANDWTSSGTCLSLTGSYNLVTGQTNTCSTHLAYTAGSNNMVNLLGHTATGDTVMSGTPAETDKFDVQWGGISSGRVITLGRSLESSHTSSFTLALVDANKKLDLACDSACTATIPPNSSVAFPIGTEIALLATATGAVTIAPGSGVTLLSDTGTGSRAIDGNASAAITKRSTDSWFITGKLK